mgnify:CR=1 FL=1
MKIKTAQEKTTRSVWPISGCIIKSKEIIDIKIIVNKYSRDHLNCLVPSMHVSAMVFEMIQASTVYFQGLNRW